MDVKQKNKDLEFNTKHFAIVPEGRLLTDGTIGGVKKRIMAVRLKPEGLREIAKRDKKAGIDFDVVVTKKQNDDNFMSGDICELRDYETVKNNIRQIMEQNKDGKLKGMIVVATNKKDNLQHAMSFVYGKVHGKNAVLFTFEDDKECLTDFIPKEYDIYSMSYKQLNNDAHSCAVGALVNVEKMLKNDAKYAKETIANGINNNKHYGIDNKGFGHEISTYFQNAKALENRYLNKQTFEKRLLFNNKKNYQNQSFLYFDDEDLLSKSDPNNKFKNINTKLVYKGKEYARRIMKDDDQNSYYSINTNYNPKDPHFLIDENQMKNVVKKYKQKYSTNKYNKTNNKQSGYYNNHKDKEDKDGCCCNIF